MYTEIYLKGIHEWSYKHYVVQKESTDIKVEYMFFNFAKRKKWIS